jgi:hypothetical protein
MFEGASYMVLSCTVVSARTLSCHWSRNTFPLKLSDNLGGIEVGTFVKGMNMQMRTIMLIVKI